MIDERKLTGVEKRSKEANFKKLKKVKGDFKDRYGKDAESVMHAVATKQAKKRRCIRASYDVQRYRKRVQSFQT